MSEISRRRVAGGVVWAVPIILVGTAIPATAASGAPALGPVAEAAYTGSEGYYSADLVIPAKNLVVGAAYTLTISSIYFPRPGGDKGEEPQPHPTTHIIWMTPDVTEFVYAGGPVFVVMKKTPNGDDVTWTAVYTLEQAGVGVVASATFTFFF